MLPVPDTPLGARRIVGILPPRGRLPEEPQLATGNWRRGAPDTPPGASADVFEIVNDIDDQIYQAQMEYAAQQAQQLTRSTAEQVTPSIARGINALNLDCSQQRRKPLPKALPLNIKPMWRTGEGEGGKDNYDKDKDGKGKDKGGKGKDKDRKGKEDKGKKRFAFAAFDKGHRLAGCKGDGSLAQGLPTAAPPEAPTEAPTEAPPEARTEAPIGWICEATSCKNRRGAEICCNGGLTVLNPPHRDCWLHYNCTCPLCGGTTCATGAFKGLQRIWDRYGLNPPPGIDGSTYGSDGDGHPSYVHGFLGDLQSEERVVIDRHGASAVHAERCISCGSLFRSVRWIRSCQYCGATVCTFCLTAHERLCAPPPPPPPPLPVQEFQETATTATPGGVKSVVCIDGTRRRGHRLTADELLLAEGAARRAEAQAAFWATEMEKETGPGAAASGSGEAGAASRETGNVYLY